LQENSSEIGIQHTEQCLHLKAKVSPSRHPYIPKNPGNHPMQAMSGLQQIVPYAV